MPELPESLHADWLRATSTGNDQRAAAVELGTATLAKVSKEEALDLVALAYKIPLPTGAELVRKAVAKHDDSFRGLPTDLQTQVAAALAAARLICSQRPVGTAVAHAVESARFLGLQPAPPDHQLAELAAARIAEQQRGSRARRQVPRGVMPEAISDLSLDEVAAASQPEVLATAVQAAFPVLQQRLTDMANAVNGRLRAADEEINLLWWVLSERYDGSGARWDEFGDAAPVLAGLNLGTLTAYTTALPSAPALLEKVIRDADRVSIRTAVVALVAREEAPSIRGFSHPLLPIMSAVSILSHDPTGLDAFAAKWKIDVDRLSEPVDLALQALREQLWRGVS